MLCRSVVNLPDWPRDTVKDVDETSEMIQGYLLAPYIVPVVRRSQKPAEAASGESGQSPAQDAEASEEPPEAPKRGRKAAS